VRVNAVSPGMVPTETFISALRLTEADLPRLTATVPRGRMGMPEDIAAAVLYLAAPASSWVTGQNLLVGGGRQGGRTVEDRWRRQ
jgi:7-alpha-hydroxysteroid dehydrogenase